jgi:isocitrate/isopropylmalate dehydrogenase
MVTLIPGDGIGEEIAESVKQIFKAAKVGQCFISGTCGGAEAGVEGKEG